MRCVHKAMAALCRAVVSEDPPAVGTLGTQCFIVAGWGSLAAGRRGCWLTECRSECPSLGVEASLVWSDG